MKKNIKNRIYDTDTARLCGSWSDSTQKVESLFIKHTGEFFLYGEYDKQITPLSADKARDWAEKHLDAAEYIKLFGPVVENDSRATVTFSLAAESIELLRRRAQADGKSMSALLDEIIKGSCRRERREAREDS